MSKRRWRTYRCQTCCWYLNVTLITEVIFLFFCACKQVWSCCRTTVMGGLLESGLELLQLRSARHFPKQEIWMKEIVRTRATVWSSFTELTVQLNWKAKASRGHTCLDCAHSSESCFEAVWKYGDKRFEREHQINLMSSSLRMCRNGLLSLRVWCVCEEGEKKTA